MFVALYLHGRNFVAASQVCVAIIRGGRSSLDVFLKFETISKAWAKTLFFLWGELRFFAFFLCLWKLCNTRERGGKKVGNDPLLFGRKINERNSLPR